MESRVLSGLKDQLPHPDLIARFVRETQEGFNRLAADRHRDQGRIDQELAKINRQIAQIIDAIADGTRHPSMRGKMSDLESRKAALEEEQERVSEDTLVLLHPGLADAYRHKVAGLTEALDDPSTQAEAATLILSLLTVIRLVPVDGRIALELVGELTGLLVLGVQSTKSRAVGAAVSVCSPLVVAKA